MTGDPTPEVVDVADAIMTDRARRQALTDMNSTRTISDMDYLRRIQPNMLGCMQGYANLASSRGSAVASVSP